MNAPNFGFSVESNAISQLRSNETHSNKENISPQPQKIEVNYTQSKQGSLEGGEVNSIQSLGEESKSQLQNIQQQEEKQRVDNYKLFNDEIEKLKSSISESSSQKASQDVVEKSQGEIKKLFASQNSVKSSENSAHSESTAGSFSFCKPEDFNEELNQQLKQKHNLWENLITVEKLGQGSFGTVFRVFDKGSRQFFALKVLTGFKDKNAKREHEALSVLVNTNHPYLLQVLQLKYIPNMEFSALMEYGQGTLHDFSKYLKQGGQQWLDKDLLELYYQLIDQINILKEIGLCHHDIKPGNIIISNDGRFKLTDYGVAEKVTKQGVQALNVDGTVGFMLPEMEEALREHKSKCELDPYEVDLFAVKKTVNYIMKEDGRTDTIEDILKKYKDTKTSNKIEIYENVKEEYKLAIFEGLYNRLDLAEKYGKFHLLADYCTFDEIVKFMKKKLHEIKDEQGIEAQRIYFLAGKLCSQNAKYDSALKFYRMSLKTNPHDKLRALVYSAVGSAETRKCAYEKAEKHHNKSLQMKQQEFGSQSLEVAEEYRNLGILESARQNNEKALEHYNKATAIYTNNPETTELHWYSIFDCIAIVEEKLEHYSEAMDRREKQVSLVKQVRGEKHPETAKALNHLGLLYWRCDKYQDALKCLKEALDIYTKIFRGDHLEVAPFYLNIGTLYRTIEKDQEALKYLKKGYKILKKNNNRHPYLLRFMNNMAVIYIDEKQYEKAEDGLKKCLKGYSEIPKESEDSVGVSYMNLGWLYEETGKLDLALDYLKKAMEIFIKLNHYRKLARCKHLTGKVLLEQNQYEEALKMLDEALGVLREEKVPCDSDLAFCQYTRGEVYFKIKMYEKAQECFLESLGLRENLFEPGHLSITEAKEYLQRIEEAKGDINGQNINDIA